MKKNMINKTGWLFLLLPQWLFAMANAPIQRIDVVNLLGSGGSTTSVLISFNNGATTPCFSTTLLYQGAITVWSGIGQPCSSPITDVSVIPIAGEDGTIYDTPVIPTSINTTLYSTQLAINQDSAPVFNPSNGALISTGTIKVVATTH